MRKLLLASAAVLGATVGTTGFASAQTTTTTSTITTQTTMPMGIMNSPTLPMPYLGGNNALNSEGNSMQNTGPTAPTPGSMVVHIHGRVNMYWGVEGGSNADHVGFNKNGPQVMLGYFRLYPGVDAQAANGLRYGGIVEIRQNFTGTPAGGQGSSGASGQSSTSTLYVRREAIYFGGPQWGIVRIGQDDGPISQFEGGVTTFQNFNDGAWNGDLPGAIPSNAQPTFPFFSGIGAEYTIQKVVYMSPQFYGFDFGFSYAPNSSVTTDAACSVASTGCQNLTSSGTALDNYRLTNMVEAIARYRANFGGVGIYAMGGYVGSGHVNNGAGPNLANGLSLGDAGLALTYAGFTVGGHVIAGNFNGQVALQPSGGANAVAWLGGIQYAAGPMTVGASWYNYQSQGATVSLGGGLATSCNGGCMSQRYENGLAIGGTYNLAPGLNFYLSYLYGERHQGNFDFVAGTAGKSNNNIHSQAFSLGTRVVW